MEGSREGESRAGDAPAGAGRAAARGPLVHGGLVVRLTEEQRAILRQIRLDADFLVKGAAGTGKTLVLLEAVLKAKGRGEQGELGLEELAGPVAFVTYSAALAGHARWLARLLGLGGRDRIQDAASFVRERLLVLEPGARVEPAIPAEFLEACRPSDLGTAAFAAEAEDFAWANLLTREEYIDEAFPRRGMRIPLQRRQRERSWAALEELEAAMRESGRWSPALAAREVAIRLRARAGTAEPAGTGAPLPAVDFAFVDEVQDLDAATLAAIKASTRRCVILAGDSGQALHRPFTSFERAGIDIVGRTRSLSVNFRNGARLHGFAERYRALGEAAGAEAGERGEAVREGPGPELLEGRTSAELLALVLGHVRLFVRELGYPAESLAILAPGAAELKALVAALAEGGFASAPLHEREFDFDEPDRIRLASLEAAKGLDFPVVLVYLPRLGHAGGAWEPAAAERLERNLLYVALTRATEHCAIFARSGLAARAVTDLALAGPAG